MKPHCLIFNLNQQRVGSAKEFLEQLDQQRKTEYGLSQARIGIARETWFYVGGEAPLLIAYIEANDIGATVAAFAASTDSFDVWFKARLAECTGVDLNNPPTLTLPEVLSHFVA